MTKSKSRSFQDLEVWKLSIDLAGKLYNLTGKPPAAENFGLTNQMRPAGCWPLGAGLWPLASGLWALACSLAGAGLAAGRWAGGGLSVREMK